MNSQIGQQKVKFRSGKEQNVLKKNLMQKNGSDYYYFWSPNNNEALRDVYFNLKTIPTFMDGDPDTRAKKGLYLCSLIKDSQSLTKIKITNLKKRLNQNNEQSEG